LTKGENEAIIQTSKKTKGQKMRREKKELLGKVRLNKELNLLIDKLLKTKYRNSYDYIFNNNKEYIKSIMTYKKFNKILESIRDRKSYKEDKNDFKDIKQRLEYFRTKKEIPVDILDEPKVRNNTHYDIPQATIYKDRHYDICSYSTYYTGQWSNKSYETYYYLIHSAYKISPMGKFCTFYAGDKEFKYKANKGFKFSNKDGICIESIKNNDINYHFDYTDFLRLDKKPKLSNFIKLAKENYKKRKEILKEKILKEKTEKKYKRFINKNDPFVFIKDSLSYGNCGVGTREFIKKYNITKKYIKASVLKRIDANNSRVIGAINKANLREFDELQKGYCNI